MDVVGEMEKKQQKPKKGNGRKKIHSAAKEKGIER